jgi:hypothetical protein
MTAVEWLVEEMLKQGYFDGNKPLTYTNLDHLQQQAKEMEKQQIIDARVNGVAEGIDIGSNPITEDISKNHEIYYNETFKKNKI